MLLSYELQNILHIRCNILHPSVVVVVVGYYYYIYKLVLQQYQILVCIYDSYVISHTYIQTLSHRESQREREKEMKEDRQADGYVCVGYDSTR